MSADTNLMPIAGAIDPVPVPRATTARADGRVELVGLSKDISAPHSKPRGWSRSRRSFAPSKSGTDLQSGRQRFRGDERHRQGATAVVHRALRHLEAEVVEAQVSSDGTRKWLLKTHDGTISRWCSSPTPTAGLCACRARSAARSIAASATTARWRLCVTSSRRRSSVR